MNLPGLGAKRVERLHQELGIDSVKALAAAIKSGKLRALKGFGAKTEERLRTALATHEETPHRFKRAVAAEVAEPLAAFLRTIPGVSEVCIAGSYRRRRDTVGDLDILVTSHADSPVMDRFVAYEDVVRVLAHGKTRASVVLRNGLQVDLRLVAGRELRLGACTTSPDPRRTISRSGGSGVARGLKINEYGIFRGARRIGGRTEEEVYRAIGLPYIEPELREDRGEIEAARNGRAASPCHPRRHSRRPARAHQGERRPRVDRRNGGRGEGTGLCVSRYHRPQPQRAHRPRARREAAGRADQGDRSAERAARRHHDA